MISDKGIGIPAGELGHIFRRFYRVTTGPPREVRGVGLGLYICKCIIEVEL